MQILTAEWSLRSDKIFFFRLSILYMIAVLTDYPIFIVLLLKIEILFTKIHKNCFPSK